MPRNLFKCSGCGHLWAGKPLSERVRTHTDAKNKDVVRCPSCGLYEGRFISTDVPSSLLRGKGAVARESAEARISKTSVEESMDDYLRLLKKSKDAESLKAGLVAMATGGAKGGDVKFEDLLKLLMVQRLGGSDDSKTAIAELKHDFQDLKRALEKPPNPGAPSPPSAGDLLARKLIESLPIASLFTDNSGGLKFGSVDDLRKAASMFTSASGRNLLDLEAEKAEHELRARKYESDSRVEFAKIIANGLRDLGRDAGWNIGAGISSGERRSSNPAQPLPVYLRAEDIGENRLRVSCPQCGEPIIYEAGRARIQCGRCGSFWSIVTQEEKSRSPGVPQGSSAGETPAPPQVGSQGSGATSSEETAKVVVGHGGGPDTKVIIPGDTSSLKSASSKMKNEVK